MCLRFCDSVQRRSRHWRSNAARATSYNSLTASATANDEPVEQEIPVKTTVGLAVFFLIAGVMPWRVASAGTPYGGSAWSVPGTVQAENFDLGGQNVGYRGLRRSYR